METAMKNWKHRVQLKPLTLALSALVLSACGQNDTLVSEEAPLRPVRTVVVEKAESGPYKEFTAVVDASQKVDLAFKVSGEIIEMPTKAGDEVTEGQLIARLDDTDIKVQLSEGPVQL